MVKGHLQGIMKCPGAGNRGVPLLWLSLMPRRSAEFTEPRKSAVLVGDKVIWTEASGRGMR